MRDREFDEELERWLQIIEAPDYEEPARKDLPALDLIILGVIALLTVVVMYGITALAGNRRARSSPSHRDAERYRLAALRRAGRLPVPEARDSIRRRKDVKYPEVPTGEDT